MKFILRSLLTMTLLGLSLHAFTQSVGINNPRPNPSAILDITSTQKGLLIPRMSQIQRDAIAAPANGLMVFVTDDNRFYYFDGNVWKTFEGTGAGGADTDWVENGANVSKPSGNVAIGSPTSDPSAILEVRSTEKGLLIPRMSAAQRDAIAAPAQGLMVFVTNDTSFYYFTGELWLPLKTTFTGGAVANVVGGTGITVNGNVINNAAPDLPVSLNGAGSVSISGTYPNFTIEGTDNVDDADNDPGNELQQLTLNGTTLSISGGNAITLPSLEEVEPYTAGTGIDLNNNLITNLAPDVPVTLNGSGATTVSGTYPDFTVSSTDNVDDADNDPGNELQQLTLNGTTLSISGGNAITLPSLEEVEPYTAGTGIDLNNNVITNLAPDLPLSLTGEGATTISGTYPNFTVRSQDSIRPPQALNVIDDTLFISDGNKVTLPKSSLWKQNGDKIYYDADHVGIKVDAPMTAFHMAANENLLLGDSLSGDGFKMIWYGSKGAMRFGYLTQPFGGYNYDKFWDYDSTGYYSFAGGQNSRAKGFGAFAWGSFGWADGSSSVAFFGNARGNNSFTFGGNSKGRGSITFEGTAEEEGGIAMYGYTGGRYGVAIGGGTTGLGASSSREDYAVAIGWNADARGQASVALGPNDAFGYNSFSTGWITEARGNYASTFGYRTLAKSYGAMALGRFNLDEGDSAVWVNSDPIFTIGNGFSSGSGQNQVITRRNVFAILKNGQTAIGYDTPVGRLQIKPISSLNQSGSLDISGATLLLGTPTTGMAFDENQIETISSALNLNYNSPEDVHIALGGGDVGVGLPPEARLDIKQKADNTGGGVRIRSDASSANFWDLFFSGATQDFTFSYRNANRAAIDAATGAYNVLSDFRLKRDIQPLQAVLPRVMQLTPSRYYYKDRPGQTQHSLGFIAQEVEPLFPELVSPLGTYKSLSYDGFSVIAIRAIQEQQAQIEALQQENRQQQADLQALKTELEALQSQMNTLIEAINPKTE